MKKNMTAEMYVDRTTSSMAIWVVEFSNGGYKIRKVFAEESTHSKEIIEVFKKQSFKSQVFSSSQKKNTSN